MSYDEYWNEDCELVRAYRKAEKIRMEKRNYELWLQGLYIYEALCDASPLYRDFAKKGTKAHPYSSKPYPLKPKAEKTPTEQESDKQIARKGENYMNGFMAAFNKGFAQRTSEQKGVSENEYND